MSNKTLWKIVSVVREIPCISTNSNRQDDDKVFRDYEENRE